MIQSIKARGSMAARVMRRAAATRVLVQGSRGTGGTWSTGIGLSNLFRSILSRFPSNGIEITTISYLSNSFLWLMQRHILGLAARRTPGTSVDDHFRENASTALVSVEAQRQHLRSLRPVSEDCTSSLTSDLLEILEPCNGLLVGELLIKCGILSKADLVTVSWFSKYGLYEAVLRAAMGMFSEDRNWTALHRMRTYYLTDPDVYGDYFARQELRKTASETAEQYLAT
ncbi:hypothetical protein CPB85DRAFT_1264429, partial [Mucidula mucida]